MLQETNIFFYLALYNLIKAEDTEIPIGFSKWMGILNNNEIKQNAKHMLGFLHQSLIENKHKVMRWKILHYILPCKTLLCQWKLSDTPTCNFCNAIEDYQHYFLTCKYLKNLWKKYT